MFIPIPYRIRNAGSRDAMPLVNAILIVTNVLVYAVGWSPYFAVGRGSFFLTIFAYAFAHAGLWHLIGNMWALLVFGTPVNKRLGNAYYLFAYLGTVTALGLFAWLFSGTLLVGASGAIFALIAVTAILMTRRGWTLLTSLCFHSRFPSA